MIWGFGGKNELPAKDEMTPGDQKMMEIKKPEQGFVDINFNPDTMPDKLKKIENGLVIIENVALLGITPGLIGPTPGEYGTYVPNRVSVMMTEKQYGEMIAEAKKKAAEQKLENATGLLCDIRGVVNSTDDRASVATKEALGLTAHPKLSPEIAKYLGEDQDSEDVRPKAESPDQKDEIPV